MATSLDGRSVKYLVRARLFYESATLQQMERDDVVWKHLAYDCAGALLAELIYTVSNRSLNAGFHPDDMIPRIVTLGWGIKNSNGMIVESRRHNDLTPDSVPISLNSKLPVTVDKALNYYYALTEANDA